MSESRIEYAIDDAHFDLFVARPEASEARPAVLVCHAWGGRDDFAEDKARALAELGYVGAAIDLYGVGQRGTDKASSETLMMGLVTKPEILRARLGEAHRQVASLAGVDANRVAVIGYCFGGLCSILMARMGLQLRAAISFHGLLKVGEPLESRPQAQILVLHGQDDPMVPPADLSAFAEEMKRVDADWRLHAYPGVMHAFTNPKANDPDFGTVYHAETDRRSWKEMRGFLAECLG